MSADFAPIPDTMRTPLGLGRGEAAQRPAPAARTGSGSALNLLASWTATSVHSTFQGT